MNNVHSNPDEKHQPRLKKSSAAAHALRHGAQAALRDERGQIIPWVLLLMFMFLGMCALVVDIGHGFLVKRELQASADAAALAAARTLPNSSWPTVGQNYSAMDSAKNDYADFSITSISVTGKCSTTIATQWNIPCSADAPNAVAVTETATIPAYFTEFIGIPTLTVSATSTASKSSKPIPLNAALIIDTTGSMNTTDASCKVNGKSVTSLQCAKNAVQTLLGLLDTSIDYVSIFTFPSLTTTSVVGDSSCTNSSVKTAPYTFPSASATTQSMSYSYITGYKNGNKNSPIYSTPVNLTYQVTAFANDYNTGKSSSSSSNSYDLNTSSSTAIAAGGVSGCNGLQSISYANSGNSVPNEYGDYTGFNTYVASVIYAAQAALVAEQNARYAASGTVSTNVIILLSDGNSSAVDDPSGSGWYDLVTGAASTVGASTSGTGTYPSTVGECGQAVDAATAVSQAYTFPVNSDKTTNTQIFTIAYGALTSSKKPSSQYSNNGNCGSDVGAGQHPNITPCQTMQQMSHGSLNGQPTNWPDDESHFYSDFNAPGGSSACQAAGGNSAITSLNDIFVNLLGALRPSRLVPNDI